MLLKERIREYAFSKLQYALTSRTFDIPVGGTSSFGGGMVMHYVSHVPESTAPVAFHANYNRAEHPPRTPVLLSLRGGMRPTPEHLKAAVEGNRKVNDILGHNGDAVPFFADDESAQRLAKMTGGEARSVVMSPDKMAHIMRDVDQRSDNSHWRGGRTGVFSHPQFGDYFRTTNHRRYIDHAQTASLATPGAGQIHEQIQNEPDNPLHRMALADHLEESGKHGLADKVRQTVPVQYRRKYAIIRFCRQRLRYSGASIDPSAPQHDAVPVASPAPTPAADPAPAIRRGSYVRLKDASGNLKGSGIHRVVDVNVYGTGKGLVKPISPSANIATDPITRVITHPMAKMAPASDAEGQAAMQQTASAMRKAEEKDKKRSAKGPRLAKSPLNATDLPPADINSHIYPDLNAGKGKLGKIFTRPGSSDHIRRKFEEWAGKPITDEHIEDMLGIPRTSHLPGGNHPIFLTGLEGGLHSTNAGTGHDPIHLSASVKSPDGSDYGYEHNNKLRFDKDGQPYLYFNIVRHSGDSMGGDKVISMPHVLWNAAVAAHANGIKKIKLHAALGGEWVGGVYWPKMGFDHNLYEAYGSDTRKWNSIVNAMQKRPHLFGGIEGKRPVEYTLLDMLHHAPTYQKYFQKSPNGSKYDTESLFPNAKNLPYAYFDTDPNSRSMKILAAYLRKIEGGPSSQQAQQGVK